jgi:TDG/mug DNA glycosylase family protein
MAGQVLPDYLGANLRVVICGTAVGKTSARRGHYYAGPGNEFWTFLHQAGLTPVSLSPEQDARILEFGIGLTDLAKTVAASSDRGLRSRFDVDEFLAKMPHRSPRVVAFHGKEAAKAVSRHLGHGREIHLGLQDWKIGESLVFILPNASGANRDASRLEGKTSRVEWYKELAALLPKQGGGRRDAKAS